MIIDGSPLGLWAIFAQKKSEEEGFKVVTYVSRALTPVEKRYKVRLNWKHLYLNGHVNVSSLM